MDERLIAQAPPLGLPLQGDEHLGVDTNGDHLAGGRASVTVTVPVEVVKVVSSTLVSGRERRRAS